ncbi:ABC transporter substrate-binding protein [Vibrio sp. Of7-15]|uniref:ABC transporter substrate-binding protein n=1 Tax=Vibrio sp. Of7-15 TaxID=2724879 RepID=UPI001EF3D1BE|nr:ABC transporter substrate-binding protein [Vibrio sp. Of7-15]MCG7499996.1 ABC transporter substrate-binding protein [Vibrio sp. Of7-15]
MNKLKTAFAVINWVRQLRYWGVILCAAWLFNSSSVVANTVVIESWRTDDAIWNEKIIPAFNRHYPKIKVEYRSPENPATFNRELMNRFENGTAGDLIACRPFDASLALFEKGYLGEITEMEGMENFPGFAVDPWKTDSGAQTFCLPMAAVIHGFFYNKAIFEELGLSEPETESDFFQLLESIHRHGQYLPISMGTQDKWEAATMGYQNIGPNYWKGEDGRLGLINGEEKMDASHYRKVFEHLRRWGRYMGQDYQQRGYNDAIHLFSSGKAAIYPAGSWDILAFQNIDMGVFRPPVPDSSDECYFSDHTDLGMGINADSKNKEAAMTFLRWMTTAEFADLFTNEVPGFFSLSNHFFEVDNEIGQTMIAWREECDSTIRSSAQILSRGTPEYEIELWETSIGVINGTMTPEQAVTRLQQGLAKWYEPQQRLEQETESEPDCLCE